MIRKIEADERKPSAQLTALLAQVLDVPDEIRPLFAQVARQLQPISQLTATSARPIAAPLAVSARLPIHSLPAPLTSLIDRLRDTAIVTKLLRDPNVRLLTLLGPPGIGKTRLAIHTAEEVTTHFRDWVFFVDLAPLTDPQLVLPAIAQMLSIAESGTMPLLDHLRAVLAERELLLVLDNFEQVNEAASERGGLLRGCKRLKILTTSRIPLLLAGEHEYPLPPLSLPPKDEIQSMGPEDLLTFESVQLFAARVRQHQHDFAITTANARGVASICLRLDGLPLALELAAAALRRLSLSQLVDVLNRDEQWLRELHSPARDLPPRQRTLYQAIGWSYDLLDSDMQRLFRRLGIFVGGFTAAAAHAICGAEETELESLADHNLLVRLPGRWQLLETIREFALTQMTDEEHALIQEKYIAYFTVRADQRLALSLADIRQDHDNFRGALAAAIARQDAEAAFTLCIKLVWYWELHGYLREGASLVRAVLALPVETPLRFDLLERTATLAFQVHDLDIATEFARQLQHLALARNDLLDQARALNLLGRILIEQGKLEQAETTLQKNEQIARQIPHLFNPGCPLAQLGEVALSRCEREKATHQFHVALAQLTSTEIDLYTGIFVAMAHTGLAELALLQSNQTQARHELRQVLPYARLYLRRLHCLMVALTGLLSASSRSTEMSQAAAKTLGAIAGLGERTGDTLSPFHQRLIADRCAVAQERLTPDEWSAAWREGYTWTPEQAAAEAEQWLTLDLIG